MVLDGHMLRLREQKMEKKNIEVNFETPLRPKQTINREENKNLIL